MHGGSWACSKRVLCCSAFAVLTTIGCVALSTTCTTHGCARRHGELRDSSKVLTDKSRGVTSPRSAGHEELIFFCFPFNRKRRYLASVGPSVDSLPWTSARRQIWRLRAPSWT